MRLQYEPASEPLHRLIHLLEQERMPDLVRMREFFIDNLLVRIHFIIVMIRWTGLAPREFESPFPGSLTSTFLDIRLIHLLEEERMPDLARLMEGGTLDTFLLGQADPLLYVHTLLALIVVTTRRWIAG